MDNERMVMLNDHHIIDHNSKKLLYVVGGGLLQLDDILEGAIKAGRGKWIDLCSLECRVTPIERERYLWGLERSGLIGRPAKDELDLKRLARNVPPMGSLVLSVIQDCQLRCKYCFARGGSYGGERQAMGFDTARAAVDLLVERSGDTDRLRVNFTGGEPLLNFPLIRRVVEYCKGIENYCGKRFSFGMATNAIGLTPDKADYICAVDGFGVVISLDGNRRVNDANRIFADGRGSYDTIVKNARYYIEKARSNGKLSAARAVYTGTEASLISIVEHLSSIGFDRVFIEPLRDPGMPPLDNARIRRISLDYEEYLSLFMRRMTEGTVIRYMDFIHLIDDIIRGSRFIYGCNAGMTMIAVSRDGTLYPCDRLIANEDAALGDVWSGIDDDKAGKLWAFAVDEKAPCNACWIRYLCGGGCHYIDSLGRCNDPNWCETKKLMAEAAMRAISEISERGNGCTKSLRRPGDIV